MEPVVTVRDVRKVLRELAGALERLQHRAEVRGKTLPIWEVQNACGEMLIYIEGVKASLRGE